MRTTVSLYGDSVSKMVANVCLWWYSSYGTSRLDRVLSQLVPNFSGPDDPRLALMFVIHVPRVYMHPNR